MTEAFFEWLTWSAFAAQIPFAEGDGFVPGVALKVHGDHGINGPQRCGAVASDVGMTGVFTGKQCAARSVP